MTHRDSGFRSLMHEFADTLAIRRRSPGIPSGTLPHHRYAHSVDCGLA